MKRRRTPTSSEVPGKTVSSPRTSTRWALLLWWLTFLTGIAVLLAALPAYAQYLRGVNVLIPSAPPGPFGLLSGLASLFTSLTCLALAVILYRRKRHEPMTLFVSFFLIAYGVVMAGPIEFLEWVVPGAGDLAVRLIQPIFFGVPTIALLVLFPDGRAVPSWTRWLIPLAALGLIFLPWLEAQPSGYRQPSGFEYVMWILIGTTLAVGIYGQVYRYRRVSSSAERQQTKWVLLGFLAWFILLMVQSLPYAYLSSLPAGTPVPAWAAASGALWFLALSIVPVCLTISILRYRLYEIDLIINRALVYGGLTAILGGLYAASISLFQRVFIAVTGDRSDAAIVVTTLILASAFTPVRTRLQAAVDKRFKDVHDPARRLRALTDEIRQGLWVLHPQQAAHRLLTEAVAAFDAAGGAVYWRRGRLEREAERVGEWNNKEALNAPIATGEAELGRIALGRRRGGSTYSAEDRRALDEAAQAIATEILRAPLPKGTPGRGRPGAPPSSSTRRRKSRRK